MNKLLKTECKLVQVTVISVDYVTLLLVQQIHALFQQYSKRQKSPNMNSNKLTTPPFYMSVTYALWFDVAS